jgi:putative membrane protein
LVFDLTKSPTVTFVLWLAAGLASLGLLPFTYSEGSTRQKLAYAGAAVLVVMSLAALATGVGGFFSHIASAVQG